MRQSFPGSKGLGSCSPTLRPFDPSTLRHLLIPYALFLILFIISMASSPLLAHEVRPAYLEIRESAPGTYDVLWKVPAKGLNLRLSLNVRFADDIEVVTEPVGGFVGGAHIQRYRIRRQGGLNGTSITIDGLASTFTDAILRLERADGTILTHRLSPDEPSYVVEANPGLGLLIWTYLVLGVEHILLGIDHLLFVFGLLLIVQGWKKLVGTITAFTLAHSITLAAATLGFVRVPGAPVEAIIALSIVFLAVEVIHGQQGRKRLTHRAPWIVAFTFGLLHGFGFAGALSEIGLPQTAIPAALFFFNVGVEAGQLLFVGALLVLALLQKSLSRRVRVPEVRFLAWEYRVAAYVIGSVSFYWVIERTATFWSSS